MRTNIEIDDQLMSEVMAGGAFKTKKEAVEAGLVLLKRQAAMRELAKMGGTVSWGWHDEEQLDGGPHCSVVEPVPLTHQVPEAATRLVVTKPVTTKPATTTLATTKPATTTLATTTPAPIKPASGVKSRARR